MWHQRALDQLTERMVHPWLKKDFARLLCVRFTRFVAALLISVAASEVVGQTLTPSEEEVQDKVIQQEEAKSRLAISSWVQSGITANPDSPRDNQNFGRFFDDRANEPLLNQVVLNFERALVPKPGEFDWGFKLQVMYGSDARFIHSLGLLDHAGSSSLLQPDIVEAYLNLHFPILSEGGVDVKLGKFVTMEGAETIDPRTNFFYSHTYIFNFGIPLNHTGALATWHATSHVNLVAGLTRGVNTSIKDNNDSLAFHGGIGLDLNESKLVISAATHIGPETAHDDHNPRYLSTITTTWKITDKLTSITDLNYARDAGADADAYGVAQYFTYTVNSWLAVGVRGEVFRDDKGFYVVSFANYHDPMRLLAGEPSIDPRTVGGGNTTYGAITLGLNIKPPVPKPAASVTIRPELRFDRALNGSHPFNDSSDRNQFTGALDVIVVF
ncbi:MAG: porin [Chthoniobacterales bacterium]|nr:MAG: porin [Chthoniobacterales bacterium]